MGYGEKINGEPARVEEPDLSGTYTASNYLSWSYDMLMELIHGRIHKMSPAPSLIHQRIFTRLFGALYQKNTNSAFQLWGAPFDVYLVKEGQSYKDALHVVQPDICLVCDEAKLQPFGCVGSPDFIIEILSPSTAKKDATLKLKLYEEFKTPEYWMVAPAEGLIIVNILNAEGTYTTMAPVATGNLAPKAFPHLSVSLEELFQAL